MNPDRGGPYESTYYTDFPSVVVDGTGNMHVVWDDYKDYSNSGTDWDIFTCDGTSLAVNGSRSRWSPTRFDFVSLNLPTVL